MLIDIMSSDYAKNDSWVLRFISQDFLYKTVNYTSFFSLVPGISFNGSVIQYYVSRCYSK